MGVSFIIRWLDVDEGHLGFVQDRALLEVGLTVSECSARTVYFASNLDRLVVPEWYLVMKTVLIFYHFLKVENDDVVQVE